MQDIICYHLASYNRFKKCAYPNLRVIYFYYVYIYKRPQYIQL